MLKKLAADALGISDIGKIIEPADFNKVDVDDYVFHEDGEKIYFVIKSKTDEYCFTNLAFIHLDGQSAVSSKRTLKRYPWHSYRVNDVSLETAGTVDLDCELKFTLGGQAFSIDVDKKQIEKLKDIYKSLFMIGRIGKENAQFLKYSEESIEAAYDISINKCLLENVSTEVDKLSKVIFDWKMEKYKQYVRKDFSEVFERYINL